jgi:hypothetical protein
MHLKSPLVHWLVHAASHTPLLQTSPEFGHGPLHMPPHPSLSPQFLPVQSGVHTHICDSAGFPVVIPQLFESVTVLVLVPPTQFDQLPNTHSGVHVGVHVCVVSGLSVETPQFFESVTVLV